MRAHGNAMGCHGQPIGAHGDAILMPMGPMERQWRAMGTHEYISEFPINRTADVTGMHFKASAAFATLGPEEASYALAHSFAVGRAAVAEARVKALSSTTHPEAAAARPIEEPKQHNPSEATASTTLEKPQQHDPSSEAPAARPAQKPKQHDPSSLPTASRPTILKPTILKPQEPASSEAPPQAHILFPGWRVDSRLPK